MSEHREIKRLTFAEDFASAQADDGRVLHFTRSESRALAILTRHRNRIATREVLLDALSELGSDKGLRNIDFVINRLRRKLSDDARNPRFIATRYGEGYLWVGDQPTIEVEIESADVLVGPINGLELMGGLNGQAKFHAREIYRAIKADVSPEQSVAYAPDFHGSAHEHPEGPDLTVELTFFLEGNTVNCVAVARKFRTSRILAMRRTTLTESAHSLSEAQRNAREMAQYLLNESWRFLSTMPDASGPLPVAMHVATGPEKIVPAEASDSVKQLQKRIEAQDQRTIAAWKQGQSRLHQLRKEEPDNPDLKLLQAVHLHTKYIKFGHKLLAQGVDERTSDEDTIETLILESLPYFQNNPDFTITAAKLLHFLDRGYSDLARDLAEDAFRASLAVVGSLSIIGQLRAFRGDTGPALQCIDQALNLSKPGSHAYLYALVIKCQILHAIDERQRLGEAKRELYAVSPLAPLFFEPLFCDPRKLSFRASMAALTLSASGMRGLLLNTHYVSARLFSVPEHRDNTLHGMLALATRRFGADVLPGEIRRAYPRLAEALS